MATPPASEAPPAATTAPYELHEWGVVDVDATGAVEISAGAGQPQRPMSVRKPVVYAHLLDGATEATFGLRVTLGAGTFVEHAPTTTITGTTLEWPHVIAHAAHCTPAERELTDATSARRGARMSCGTSDGICEITELPRYDAPSSACLDVDGAQVGLLFYRAQVPTVTLPIAVQRASDLTLTVSATSALAGTPGGLIRLSTALSGPWPQGRVVVSRAGFPASGASVTMPVGTEVITRAAGIAELGHAIQTLGLTEDEASAFMAGWADELFGADAGARDQVGGVRHQDVLLFFLPASAIDPIARLQATPSPRAIHRAIMVRIDLGAVTTA